MYIYNGLIDFNNTHCLKSNLCLFKYVNGVNLNNNGLNMYFCIIRD